MKKTQLEEVREILMTKGSITPLEALNSCGCFRLSRIIYRLRHEGMDIKTEDERDSKGNIYARYTHKVSEEEIEEQAKALFDEILAAYESKGHDYLVIDRSSGRLFLSDKIVSNLNNGECLFTAGLSMKEVSDLATEAIKIRYKNNLKNN